MTSITAALGFLAMAAAVGCDPVANATAPGSGAAASAAAKPSAEWEGCAASADCADDLRCVDAICQRADSHMVAEYHIALGDSRTSRGQIVDAIASYRAAESALAADKVEPTLPLVCGLGAALAASSDPAAGEEAAARLHRCAQLAPPGSRARRAALDHLAELSTAGFDPSHLASAKPVARYLTGAPAPAAPAAEAAPAAAPAAPVAPVAADRPLAIELSTDSTPRSRSFTKFMALLETDDVDAAFRRCWDAHVSATGARSLSVVFPLEHSYRLDDNDDFDHAVLEIGDPVAASETEAAAGRCIQAALSPIAAEFARKTGSDTRWKVQLTLKLGT